MYKTKIAENVKSILWEIGEDTEREGIKHTPDRVARMYDTFLYGYRKKLVIMDEGRRNKLDYGKDDIPITTFKNTSKGLLIRKTKFISFCEHHMVNFFGVVYVGIIPDKLLLGMSKIDKIVKYFAARLQIQERMATQIVDWIDNNLKPRGVIVIIKAKHMCAEIQGDSGNFTNSEVRGIFLKPEEGKTPKEEFLRLVGL